MSDKMRDEFEAWSMKEYPGTLLARASTGGYRNLYVQMCWLGWKASRESLVIELPKVEGIHCDAQKYMRNGCRLAIETAGLKVKS